jgi:hypothetical protein
VGGGGDWRRLLRNKFHNFYGSPIIRVRKSKRIGLAGYVARMG